jgi:hypothetical protein
VSVAPTASDKGSQRARAVRASRMTPITASSDVVRSHHRIRRGRAGRQAQDRPGTADELHTTRFL